MNIDCCFPIDSSRSFIMDGLTLKVGNIYYGIEGSMTKP